MASAARSSPLAWRPILGLLIVWIAALLIANPRGDFPLCDDWCYGFSVRQLLKTGEIHYCAYVQATAYTHLLWGCLFTFVSHFSYNVLRISTLVLAAVGTVTVWQLVREVGGSSRTAVVVAAAFVFNPIVFLLSNTFMTDVPFAAWSALSALWLVRALKRPAAGTLIPATLFAVAAALLRQFGLLPPAVFAAAYLLLWGPSWRRILTAALPFAVVALAMRGHQAWMDAVGRQPQFYAFLGESVGPLRDPHNWIPIVKRFANASFHQSWYLLPVMLWTQRRPPTPAGRRVLVGVVISSVAIVYASGRVAPWASAVLYDIGIGPPMLRDGDMASAGLPHAPRIVWQLGTLAAAASAGLFVLRIATFFRRVGSVRACRGRVDVAAVVLLLGSAALSISAMAVLQFYDRYLLAPTVMLFAVAVVTRDAAGETPLRFARAGALVTLAFMSVFAVASTHDYFEWNRARWAALLPLVNARAYDPLDVDGGYEFRGEYSVHPSVNWTTVKQPKAVVAFNDMPGFTRCETFPYRRWMPPREDRLVLLVPAGDVCPALSK